jgi:hypothetical protein
MCKCPYEKPCGKKPCDDGGVCPKDKYPIIDPWPYTPVIPYPYQPYWPTYPTYPTRPLWVYQPVYTTCTTGEGYYG